MDWSCIRTYFDFSCLSEKLQIRYKCLTRFITPSEKYFQRYGRFKLWDGYFPRTLNGITWHKWIRMLTQGLKSLTCNRAPMIFSNIELTGQG